MIEGYEWIVSLPSLVLIAMAGMLVHYMKQKITGETIADIWVYFSSHFKSTLITVVATMLFTVSYFLTLSTEMPADILTVFGLGYMSDSAFNKWDNKKSSE